MASCIAHSLNGKSPLGCCDPNTFHCSAVCCLTVRMTAVGRLLDRLIWSPESEIWFLAEAGFFVALRRNDYGALWLPRGPFGRTRLLNFRLVCSAGFGVGIFSPCEGFRTLRLAGIRSAFSSSMPSRTNSLVGMVSPKGFMP